MHLATAVSRHCQGSCCQIQPCRKGWMHDLQSAGTCCTVVATLQVLLHSTCNLAAAVHFAAPSYKCKEESTKAVWVTDLSHCAQAPCACTQQLRSHKFELRNSYFEDRKCGVPTRFNAVLLHTSNLGCKTCKRQKQSLHASMELPSPLLCVDSCTLASPLAPAFAIL